MTCICLTRPPDKGAACADPDGRDFYQHNDASGRIDRGGCGSG